MVMETLENWLYMLLVLRQIGGIDKYVVDVDNDKPVEILSENLAHKPLEELGGIG